MAPSGTCRRVGMIRNQLAGDLSELLPPPGRAVPGGAQIAQVPGWDRASQLRNDHTASVAARTGD